MQLFSGINVVSISVTDLDRAREFYRDTLGLGPPLYDLPEAGWIEFSTGANGGNLSVTTAEPGWRAVLRHDDRAQCSRLPTSRGGAAAARCQVR